MSDMTKAELVRENTRIKRENQELRVTLKVWQRMPIWMLIKKAILG